MADRIHELKQTQSAFQVRGKVSGVKKDSFYIEGVSKSGGKWNAINFAVEFEPHKFVYIKLNGFPRKEVFYYKAAEKKGEKGVTERVAWANRMKSPGKGFRLIGVNIGLEKGKDGKNINEMYTEYDAVEKMRDALTDGLDVFIKGAINFSSFTNRNGDVTRSVELTPSQVSLCTRAIDFDVEDFEPMAAFENDLLFTEVNKEMDEKGKATGRFVVSGYSVGYNTVEPVEFIIDEKHAKMAGSFKKAVKPYSLIKTFGVINVQNQVEEVEVDDAWGDAHSVMERVNGPVVREYVIVKAIPDSIDNTLYSEESVGEALRKIRASKEAESNFEVVGADDWGDEEESGGEPW